MDTISPYLPDIWLVIIGTLLLYYVVADGYDLGVGILSLFCRSGQERSIMAGSLKAVWASNQTWLVLLGGMAFGAFPIFYSLLLSSLYVPIVIMLFGLIFRGLAIELSGHDRFKAFWGPAFGLGSLVTALAQGFAAGALFGGLDIVQLRFVGGMWDWLSPFAVLAALTLLACYVMLGANYLILKTEGDLQAGSYRTARRASAATLVLGAAIFVWNVLRFPYIRERWVHPSTLFYVAVFPLLALLAFSLYRRSLSRSDSLAPLLWSALFVVLAFVGLSAGIYPVIIPGITGHITIREASAHPATLAFMLVAVAILFPIILTYNIYNYRVFGGKTREGKYE
ncbi:MAG TPA: cytochrome d ubiquinol oxidase subunit II [Syntrophales bacterium]|nr:cytochrome d ubiquinol oxidase subunit II [Syntrophales bacterium]